MEDPRILSKGDLLELSVELDRLSERLTGLDEWSDSTEIDDIQSRIKEIFLTLEKSYKLAKIKESGLKIIK